MKHINESSTAVYIDIYDAEARYWLGVIEDLMDMGIEDGELWDDAWDEFSRNAETAQQLRNELAAAA